jgi:hypothetical protein
MMEQEISDRPSGLQACRSDVFWKGFNRSWFYDEDASFQPCDFR